MGSLPQVSGSHPVRALEKLGWTRARATGHVQMVHVDRPGIVVSIPLHRADVKRGTLRSILRSANISVDELKEVL